MALSGNFSGKTSNQFVKPTIYWSAVQNIEGNYSDVTVELRYSRTNTGYTTEGNFSGALYIDKGTDGEQKQTGSKSSFKVTYKSNSLAMSKTFRVNHSSNGSKKITISATGSIPPSSVTSTTISQEVELDTIPRASSIGATDANIGAASMIVVTKKNTAYKHSVAYSFGDLSGYIKADGTVTDSEVIFSETSIAFALPDDFYAQIPKVKSGKCSLTCKTYYGSTQIGEDQTVTFTAVAAESVCAPSVSGTVVDVNETTKALTGDENKLVRYHSKAKCTITASAKNAATLASKTVNGKAISNTLEISNAETGNFAFTAKDSRGYGKSATVKKDLIPYVKLTVNASVKRTDPTSGRAVLTVKGNFYNGGFGAEENTLTLSCQVGSGVPVTLTPAISGNSYSVSTTLEGLSYDSTHSITVSASDKLEEVSSTVTVQKGLPGFDWGEKDFQFHMPVKTDENMDIKPVDLTAFKGFRTFRKPSANASVTHMSQFGVTTTPGASVYLYKDAGDGNGYTLENQLTLAETYTSLRQPLNIASGGTGASTEADALANLGALNLNMITDAGYMMSSGDDLNDYTTPGAYRCATAAIAGSLLNITPYKYAGFRLIVSSTSTANGVLQFVIFNSVRNHLYFRIRNDTGDWSAWVNLSHSGNSGMTPIWENLKPTSTYAATTEKPTGYGDYEAVIVCARLSTTVANELPPVFIRKGGSAANIYGVLSGKFCRRTVSFTDAGIVFEAAGQMASYGGSFADNNSAIIPTVIYGVKGVV